MAKFLCFVLDLCPDAGALQRGSMQVPGMNLRGEIASRAELAKIGLACIRCNSSAGRPKLAPYHSAAKHQTVHLTKPRHADFPSIGRAAMHQQVLDDIEVPQFGRKNPLGDPSRHVHNHLLMPLLRSKTLK